MTKIWLQQDESYFPSNVELLLNNTHVETHPDILFVEGSAGAAGRPRGSSGKGAA